MLKNTTLVPTLRTADINRAKKFYTETLGLPMVADIGGSFTVGWGENRLAVYERPDSKPPENTVATWETDDIQAAAHYLNERGITPDRPDMPGVEYDDLGIARADGMPMTGVWFTDTEGNVLQIMQMGG